MHGVTTYERNDRPTDRGDQSASAVLNGRPLFARVDLGSVCEDWQPDLGGGRLVEAVAEDPAGRGGAVGPERERRVEVRQSDVAVAVERGVDRRETNDVRFGAAGGGAEQALIAA
jgi:hypothetical protein